MNGKHTHTRYLIPPLSILHVHDKVMSDKSGFQKHAPLLLPPLFFPLLLLLLPVVPLNKLYIVVPWGLALTWVFGASKARQLIDTYNLNLIQVDFSPGRPASHRAHVGSRGTLLEVCAKGMVANNVR